MEVYCVFFSLWCENDSRLQKDLKKQPSRSPQLAHMYGIVITENDFFLVNNKILFGTRNTSLVRVSIEVSCCRKMTVESGP